MAFILKKIRNIRQRITIIERFKIRDNYNKFISGNEGKWTLFLELGVGYNTPGIIRFPFEAMVRNNPNALLVRLNRDHMNGMSEILGSSTSFDKDMTTVINDIRNY